MFQHPRASQHCVTGDPLAEGEQRIDAWRQLQDIAAPYFARRHLALLRAAESELTGAIANAEGARDAVDARLIDYRSQRDVVNAAIASSDIGVTHQALR